MHDQTKHQTIPILMYHEVYQNTSEYEYCQRRMGPSFAIAQDTFKSHLETMETVGIRARALSDLKKRSHSTDQKVAVITFDDGHIGNYKYAYPLLLEKEMATVFFVGTKLIGSKNMMSWTQLREMADQGMSIQSHGISHEPFETFSDKQLEKELLGSRMEIEDKIGKRVDTISLPHGSIHPKTLKKAQAIGYRFVCTSQVDYFRYINSESISLVPRIQISAHMASSIFNEIVTGTCSEIYRWGRMQKMKYLLKKLIGINNYRRIYRLTHQIKI